MKHSAGEIDPPTYALGSVDRALLVLHMLRNGAPLRITAIAQHLQVSVSTAHRIVSMLVFHGFAVQDEHRHYLSGRRSAHRC
ncbi:hypothetical protein GCM10027421_32210 [Microbacterium shaanxiense]